MKKASVTLLAATLVSLTPFVSADEGIALEVQTTTNNAHRVYAGPEFMWSHFHGDIQHLEVSRNTYYGGLRFGYEYLQPESFYAATDAIAAMGAEKGKVSGDDAKFKDRAKEVFKGNRGHFWSNVEQRFGYTFSSSLVPSCTVSVFAGPGFHYEHEKGRHSLWGYAHTGLKAVQHFNDTFSVGTDVKVMYAFGANDTLLTRPTTLGKKQFLGYEFGVPFNWTLGDTKSFDIQLKPYLLKLNASSKETIVGSTLALGYKF
ncbi:MAG TPA: hypothetical protein VHA52_13110 [Candidatus Babeliaceae bacterium]|nr:hypothetical protein [Candidatus Babeliaceae bacterium]